MIERAVFDFLSDHSIGVLATTAADGTPQACTVFYATDADCSLIFKSRMTSDHMQSVFRDNRAALAVYRHDSIYKLKAGVQLKGVIVKIREAGEMSAAVDLYSAHFEGAREKFAPISNLLHSDAESTLYRFVPAEYKLTDGWSNRLDLDYRPAR